MTTIENLTADLTDLLQRELNVRIPTSDTDLFEEGIIDSFGLVNLMFLIEKQWGVRIALDDMELDNFRTVQRVARFIEYHDELRQS